MCSDCGCSVTGALHKEGHRHDPGGGHNHHHHHDRLQEHIAHSGSANPALSEAKTVTVLKNILEENDREAAHIREHLDTRGIFAINVMGSPGSGKTSLLETTASRFPGQLYAIEGDLETDRDAERLRRAGIPAHQITTGQACHLDAFMIHGALHNFEVKNNGVLFVENVGNLVCPAMYDIGTHINVVLLSVTEGDDKIAKYPVMFRNADILIITKSDLLPHVSFDLEAARQDFRRINRSADLLLLSSRDPESMESWYTFLEYRRGARD
jgi:hydrogenase nickel incorporation protein HypB